MYFYYSSSYKPYIILDRSTLSLSKLKIHRERHCPIFLLKASYHLWIIMTDLELVESRLASLRCVCICAWFLIWYFTFKFIDENKATAEMVRASWPAHTWCNTFWDLGVPKASRILSSGKCAFCLPRDPEGDEEC